jgi:hypothetical protein
VVTGENKVQSPDSISFLRSAGYRPENRSSQQLIVYCSPGKFEGAVIDTHLHRIVAMIRCASREEMDGHFESESKVPFKSLSIWSTGDDFCLVPNALFSQRSPADWAALSFEVAQRALLQKQVKEVEAVLLHTDLGHAQSLVAAELQLSSKLGTGVFVFLHERHFDLIQWKGGNLELCVRNVLEGPADPAYLVSSLLKDAPETEIFLAGLTHLDETRALLQRFYPKVASMPSISNLWNEGDFPGVRMVEYFLPIHLHLCAS